MLHDFEGASEVFQLVVVIFPPFARLRIESDNRIDVCSLSAARHPELSVVVEDESVHTHVVMVSCYGRLQRAVLVGIVLDELSVLQFEETAAARADEHVVLVLRVECDGCGVGDPGRVIGCDLIEYRPVSVIIAYLCEERTA